MNIKLLDRFNCVGINYFSYPQKHFLGNFWWSKSEYISKLFLQINENNLLSEKFIFDNIKINSICIYNKFKLDVEHPEELYIYLNDSEILNNCTNIPLINNENPINEFNWIFYINKYPDLKRNGINNESKALIHWKKFGIKEGRIGWE